MPFMKRMVAVAVLGASLLGASSASAENVDLSVAGEITSRNGAERTVKFTLTNDGPDALATREFGLYVTALGADGKIGGGEILSATPCGKTVDVTALSPPSVLRVCGFGKTLAAGKSVSLVARARGTSPGAQLRGSVYFSDDNEDPPQDSDLEPAFVSLDGSGCELQAKGSQKASKALVVTVFGADSGCEAKLKSAKLKVGPKVYTFIKKHPSKDVAAGEKWKVSVPVKGQVLDTVKKALASKKGVKAAAEFALDGESDSIVVKIK